MWVKYPVSWIPLIGGTLVFEPVAIMNFSTVRLSPFTSRYLQIDARHIMALGGSVETVRTHQLGLENSEQDNEPYSQCSALLYAPVISWGQTTFREYESECDGKRGQSSCPTF